jgi:hypothetical protein
MPKASEIGMPADKELWPLEGDIVATCVQADRWVSPHKKTPAVRLTFTDAEGHYNFSDLVFVTAKTIQRLNLVAQRLCGMLAETDLPADAKQTAAFLAHYILAHARGKQVLLSVEIEEQEFVYTYGEKVGQKAVRRQPRVGFAGYKRLPDASDSVVPPKPAALSPPATQEPEDPIPF